MDNEEMDTEFDQEGVTTSSDLIDSILGDRMTDAESQFDDIMGDRVSAAIDQRKVDIAQSMYSDEAPDDTDFDDEVVAEIDGLDDEE